MVRNHDVLVAAPRPGRKLPGIIRVQFALMNNIHVQFIYRFITRCWLFYIWRLLRCYRYLCAVAFFYELFFDSILSTLLPLGFGRADILAVQNHVSLDSLICLGTIFDCIVIC